MATINLGDRRVKIVDGQSVLDALLGIGVAVPNSCRAGVCQSCMAQAESGELPAASQSGLKETLKQQNYFLPCACYPESDLTIFDFSSERISATVVDLIRRSERVLEIHLQGEGDFPYHPGQYLMVWCSLEGMENESRCYSLASVPGLDDRLVIQVGKVNGGMLSGWLHEQSFIGQKIDIQRAIGDCFFVPQKPEQPILLVGMGTGLAPIYGIARDALQKNHQGELHLCHSARSTEELYLHQELLALAKNHEQFHYHPLVRSGLTQSTKLSVEAMIASAFPCLSGWQIYLCGAEETVGKLRKQSFLAGASMQQIFSDAFVSRHSVKK